MRTNSNIRRYRQRSCKLGRYCAATLLLLLSAKFAPLLATPVPEGKVRKAVETWVRRVTADRRHDAEIARLETYERKGQTVAYVVHLASGGYCLAGADSLVLPVYWYSPTGAYDPKSPAKEVLEEIADRIEFLHGEQARGGVTLRTHQDALSKRERFWDNLAAGEASAEGGCQPNPEPFGPGVLELPFTSKWNQGTPYNIACPAVPTGSDNHVQVGCVATATAQLMNYWRWPSSGSLAAVGRYTFRWTGIPVSIPLASDPGVGAAWQGGRMGWANGFLWLNGSWDDSVLQGAKAISSDAGYRNALQFLFDSLPEGQTDYSADFGATTYHWELLRDTHSAPADDGAREVAKLCFHVGVAVNMGYGLLESSASAWDVPWALVAGFGYDPAAIIQSRDLNLMIDELRWFRPILFRGRTATDGHFWVVYGYNLQTSPWQFKMNMGWGGDSDGWYSVDCVPKDLVNDQYHVTRIAPLDTVRFVGASIPGVGSPILPHRDIAEALDHAPDRATLVFKADSLNTFSSSTLTINRPLTLKGVNATLRK